MMNFFLQSRSAVNDWLNGRGLSETNAMNNSVDVRLESCEGANLTDESFSNREQPARSVRPPTYNPKKNADFYEDNLSESFAFMCKFLSCLFGFGFFFVRRRRANC